MIKKRPIGAISNEVNSQDDSANSLTAQVGSLGPISGTPSVSSIYTGQGEIETSSPQDVQRHTYEGIQTQLLDAIKSVADMKPSHHRIATNANGSKRAHVLIHEPHTSFSQQRSHLLQEGQHGTIKTYEHGIKPAASTPLPLSQPFRLPNHVVHPASNEYQLSSTQETQNFYQPLHYKTQPESICNPSYHQPRDDNFDARSSYSYSTFQQQQTSKETERIPVPTQVYSIPMDEPNATSAPTTPFMLQNTSSTGNAINISDSAKIVTSRHSSTRSTANISKTKVSFYSNFTTSTNLFHLVPYDIPFREYFRKTKVLSNTRVR